MRASKSIVFVHFTALYDLCIFCACSNLLFDCRRHMCVCVHVSLTRRRLFCPFFSKKKKSVNSFKSIVISIFNLMVSSAVSQLLSFVAVALAGRDRRRRRRHRGCCWNSICWTPIAQSNRNYIISFFIFFGENNNNADENNKAKTVRDFIFGTATAHHADSAAHRVHTSRTMMLLMCHSITQMVCVFV